MLVLHAIISGHVQGVGFRWTLVDHAEKHHLNGTVQNLPNGTVEVYAQGSKAALEAFIASVQSEPGFARIDSIQAHFKESSQPYSGFRIIQD